MIDIDNTKPEDYQNDREPDEEDYREEWELNSDEQTPEQENAWLRDMGF